MRTKEVSTHIVPLWTDVQLAEFLQIAPQTIANRISQGRQMPPHVRVGGARRWIVEQVVDWLKSQQ
ncbi:helix-turn-helix transcriptional regulator [Salinisphaera orenii]|uniref:helix-turn-helix transcriptional regulator n=1 Tax=Salinisphaera orenii TaxID=856731 RepID=UPI0011CDAAF3|nr:helix-turn-helix domain-containing protein [Salinisphaera halophila]